MAACGALEGLTYGKLPLRKVHIWEVATWEIVTWSVALGKMSLGKYLTPETIHRHTFFNKKKTKRMNDKKFVLTHVKSIVLVLVCFSLKS